MRPATGVLAIVLLGALAAVAWPRSDTRDDPRRTEGQRLSPSAARTRLGAALRLVAPSPHALGYDVTAEPRVDPAVRAQVDLDARRITVFVAARDALHTTAHDLAHELGHAVDAERLTNRDRSAYLQRRGVRSARWWPRDERSDYHVGAGDFAEVYALCHGSSPDFRSRLAGRPADACGVLPRSAR